MDFDKDAALWPLSIKVISSGLTAFLCRFFRVLRFMTLPLSRCLHVRQWTHSLDHHNQVDLWKVGEGFQDLVVELRLWCHWWTFDGTKAIQPGYIQNLRTLNVVVQWYTYVTFVCMTGSQGSVRERVNLKWIINHSLFAFLFLPGEIEDVKYYRMTISYCRDLYQCSSIRQVH